jgi:hypothetical protein
MYRQQILALLKTCQEAESKGASPVDIRSQILPVLIQPFLDSAKDFLTWIKEDREYSSYYFEVQESGVCAKPVEAAALILEAIVVDHLEQGETQ